MSAASAPAGLAGPSATALRRTLGRYATGVALLTAPGPHGLIVNSFTSVSLQPPLIAFCPSRDSLTWARMRGAARLGVNVLAADQATYAATAARRGADRFRGARHVLRQSGVPRLLDAIAFLECTPAAEHPAGDHTIVVARVEHARTGRDAVPLVFWAGAYGRLSTTGPPRGGSRFITNTDDTLGALP